MLGVEFCNIPGPLGGPAFLVAAGGAARRGNMGTAVLGRVVFTSLVFGKEDLGSGAVGMATFLMGCGGMLHDLEKRWLSRWSMRR